VIRSLRNMFRYLRSTISTESRHFGSGSLQVGHPFDNSRITRHPEGYGFRIPEISPASPKRPTRPCSSSKGLNGVRGLKGIAGGYASLVQLVGGAQSFAINWPSNVATVCATPGPPPASDPFPVHLSAQDRGTSNATYDHLTLAVTSYESSAEVSPFSSKFYGWLFGNATIEQQ
jgi:hypothetical protein